MKRISCPVHGSIELSDLEVRLIETPAFQRLREIRQLGLANYVYPSADYSRFSHSVGVCHMAGRMLAACGLKADSPEVQECRLAGLLHDIGHYPFSHATESAVKEWAAVKGFETDRDVEFLNHESLGDQVLRFDPDISALLTNAQVDPERISGIFTRKFPGLMGNSVSSDLDGDRIDYLLRTSKTTGLPYGSVDVDYLLSQLIKDRGSGKICLKRKAIRTADHFLLCRFFDYQQVAFHKTVAGFEWLLSVVLTQLMLNDKVPASPGRLKDMIRNREWSEYTDARTMSVIVEAARQTSTILEEPHKQMAQAIVQRKPPRLVFSEERYVNNESGSTEPDGVAELIKFLKGKVRDWSSEFRIPLPHWRIWHLSPEWATIGESGELGKPSDKQAKAIHISDGINDSPIPITSHQASIMSVLSKYVYRPIRVYVLCESGGQAEIRKRLQGDVTDWKKQVQFNDI